MSFQNIQYQHISDFAYITLTTKKDVIQFYNDLESSLKNEGTLNRKSYTLISDKKYLYFKADGIMSNPQPKKGLKKFIKNSIESVSFMKE